MPDTRHIREDARGESIPLLENPRNRPPVDEVAAATLAELQLQTRLLSRLVDLLEPKVAKPTREPRLNRESQAIALLLQGVRKSSQIASIVGVHRNTLRSWKRFQAARDGLVHADARRGFQTMGGGVESAHYDDEMEMD